MMHSLIQNIGSSFRHLLYPSLCLNCEVVLRHPSHLLCADCLPLLILIDPKERCPRCFSSSYCPEQRLCSECHRQQWILAKSAAAFDYAGPASAIIRKMKYGNQPYLAKDAAAFMVAQLIALEWPLPDLLVPVPISLTHWMTRGYNQSLLLAQHIAELIGRPVSDCLGRKSGDYSQAGLTRQQRLAFEGRTLFLKKEDLRDKVILLIDDVMTTGSTMNRCANILIEGLPSAIYALTFTRALTGI